MFMEYMCPGCGCSTNIPIKGLGGIEVNNITKEQAIEEVKCIHCNEKFTIEEGIIRYLTFDDPMLDYSIISDCGFIGSVTGVVGQPVKVMLPRKIRQIHNIRVNPIGGFFEGIAQYPKIDPNNRQIDSFTIYFCESDVSDSLKTKMGELVTANYTVYGKDKDYDCVWKNLIVQAKKEIIEFNYSMAILSSEMAIESFIDTLLTELFKKKNLNEKTIETLLVSVRSIQDKVYRLLKYLDDINLREENSLSRGWKKLMELRNKIAHGERVGHTREEALNYFEIAIRVIYFLNRKSSVDLIYFK